jgi:hypothetical protein
MRLCCRAPLSAEGSITVRGGAEHWLVLGAGAGTLGAGTFQLGPSQLGPSQLGPSQLGPFSWDIHSWDLPRREHCNRWNRWNRCDRCDRIGVPGARGLGGGLWEPEPQAHECSRPAPLRCICACASAGGAQALSPEPLRYVPSPRRGPACAAEQAGAMPGCCWTRWRASCVRCSRGRCRCAGGF